MTDPPVPVFRNEPTEMYVACGSPDCDATHRGHKDIYRLELHALGWGGNSDNIMVCPKCRAEADREAPTSMTEADLTHDAPGSSPGSPT